MPNGILRATLPSSSMKVMLAVSCESSETLASAVFMTPAISSRHTSQKPLSLYLLALSRELTLALAFQSICLHLEPREMQTRHRQTLLRLCIALLALYAR